LRADVSQRPTFRISKDDLLPIRVEQALTTLLLREVKLQIKAENIKRLFEGRYDFNIQSAYKVIDDWSYGYLDARNLRRFLRNMGVLVSKQELVALIRRIDLDGDAKISYEEFFEGIKSQFSQVNKIG
jgi:Ca2+-binding EF-hand superfamily protein